jgi:hypothetical protein
MDDNTIAVVKLSKTDRRKDAIAEYLAKWFNMIVTRVTTNIKSNCSSHFIDEVAGGGYLLVEALEGIGVCMDTSKIKQKRAKLLREDVFREVSNLNESDKARAVTEAHFYAANSAIEERKE